LNKLLPLLAFSILLLVPVGAQQVFAGSPPPPDFELIETFTPIDQTIEYTLINNAQDLGPDPEDTPFVFAFAVEVDESFALPGTPEFNVGRTNWDAVFLSSDEWNGGLVVSDGFQLTSDPAFGFSGLFTDDLGAFDQIFSGQFRVALFYDVIAQGGDFVNANLILPQTSSDPGDFVIDSAAPLSLVVVICNNPFNPACAFFDATEVVVEDQGVGGSIIPIEQTSLILAGTQSFSWMIPVVLSGIGIGLFVFRKSENS